MYQDLLAIIATTERQMYRLKFEEDSHVSELQDFLLKRLSFDSISTSINIEDVSRCNFIFRRVYILLIKNESMKMFMAICRIIDYFRHKT